MWKENRRVGLWIAVGNTSRHIRLGKGKANLFVSPLRFLGLIRPEKIREREAREERDDTCARVLPPRAPAPLFPHLHMQARVTLST